MMLRKISEPNKRKFTTSETILLVVMSLLIGFAIGCLIRKTNIITKKSVMSDENLQEFVTNYEYILNNYYEELDKRKLINSAIDGMMQSLDDPYSVYFDKSESENFSITLDGSYKGIGVQVTKDPHEIAVAALESGLIVLTAGKDVVRMLPPLTITEAEIETGLKILKKVLA